MNWSELSRFAPLPLRIILAVSFVLHGFSKLANSAGVVKFFTGLGIPMPSLMVPVVGTIEVLGGILLLLGLGTRIASVLLVIVLLVAIVTAKIGKGYMGAELEIALLAGTLSLLLSGPGPLSLQRKKQASSSATVVR